MKIFTNKKAQMVAPESTGFKWVKTLILIFVIGFLFVTVSVAFNQYFKPTVDNLISTDTSLNSTQISDAMYTGNKMQAFFMAFPIIVIITLGIGLILSAIANQRNDGEY